MGDKRLKDMFIEGIRLHFDSPADNTTGQALLEVLDTSASKSKPLD